MSCNRIAKTWPRQTPVTMTVEWLLQLHSTQSYLVVQLLYRKLLCNHCEPMCATIVMRLQLITTVCDYLQPKIASAPCCMSLYDALDALNTKPSIFIIKLLISFKPSSQWLHDSLWWNGCMTKYNCVPWSCDCCSSCSTLMVAIARVWLGQTFMMRLQLVTTVCDYFQPRIAMCTVSYVTQQHIGCLKQIISSIL